jgi:phospholipase C
MSYLSKMRGLTRALLTALIGAVGLTSCAGNPWSPSTPVGLQRGAVPGEHHRSTSYIAHVIVVIQENRSFDDLFSTFPGVDGTTTGKIRGRHGARKIPLQRVSLVEPCDFGHSYNGFITDLDHGRMDGFSKEGVSMQCEPGPAGKRPYQYVDPSQIAPYWQIANTYVLADHMFQTQGSGSYTAHQDLIRGGTMINQTQTRSLVDSPTSLPWGCDNGTPGTTTPLLIWSKNTLHHQGGGPFPCTTKFPEKGAYYETLATLLDNAGVSWKYYSPSVKPGVGRYWNAFDTIASVRYGPEWGTNVTTTEPFEKAIFSDIQYGKLADVSWVIPDETNSDHPGSGSDTGPSWVASVVDAVGQSSYWSSTAIVIVWDDWGGFYDHVAPPITDEWGGLGFRVPMLVVSPYTRKGSGSQGGYISTTQYEFGSILKFIENNWTLPSLGTTDGRANSIADCFNFSHHGRKFKAIASKYSRSYFERQPESLRPVDSQ